MELVMARSQELQRLQAELEAAVDETFARYGAACLWWMRQTSKRGPWDSAHDGLFTASRGSGCCTGPQSSGWRI